MEETDLLTFPEAAELLGLSYAALTRRVARGVFHVIDHNPGGLRRVPRLRRAEVLAYRDRYER